jgi:hypothetical protein
LKSERPHVKSDRYCGKAEPSLAHLARFDLFEPRLPEIDPLIALRNRS